LYDIIRIRFYRTFSDDEEEKIEPHVLVQTLQEKRVKLEQGEKVEALTGRIERIIERVEKLDHKFEERRNTFIQKVKGRIYKELRNNDSILPDIDQEQHGEFKSNFESDEDEDEDAPFYTKINSK
jgi:hypothetical protein